MALAVAAVMLHERAPLRRVVRRLFLRRPFILTNRSFRAQLVDLAQRHGLLEDTAPAARRNDWAAAAPSDADAGCSSELLCPHCGQPHVVAPLARIDATLRVEARTFTVGGLARLLQLRFGAGNADTDLDDVRVNIDCASRRQPPIPGRVPAAGAPFPHGLVWCHNAPL